MLYLFDRDGKHRFSVHQQENGAQQLAIYGESGDFRLLLGEADDGTPMLFLYDRDGKPLLR